MIEKILLDNKFTWNEKNRIWRPSNGSVFGQIYFLAKNIGYEFINKYCIDNLIKFQTDFSNDKLISIGEMKKIKIYNI